MKTIKATRQAKVNNWLTHKETRDEIWDLMASKWAIKAENLSRYSKAHLPEPVKSVLRTTIKKPLQSAKKYQLKRKETKKIVAKSFQLSRASK